MYSRAFLKLGAVAVLLLQAHPQRAAAQVIEDDVHVIAGCPSSDIPTAAGIRRGIDKSLEHGITYPSVFSASAKYIEHVELPRLLIVSGRAEHLDLLWNKRAIKNSADLNTAFHHALNTKNVSLMRAVASSNVRRTRTQGPFLAPGAELPALAALYVKLFERSSDLTTEYRKLSAITLVEARRAGRARARMQDEGNEDRRRLAVAWMLFHLERIRMQLPETGKGRAQPGELLDTAARLVSRECQPRTWQLIESLRTRKSVCWDGQRAGTLLKSDHPYVCKLVEPMEAGETVATGVQPELLKWIDAWRREQPDLPSRPEALRRLAAKGLGGE